MLFSVRVSLIFWYANAGSGADMGPLSIADFGLRMCQLRIADFGLSEEWGDDFRI